MENSETPKYFKIRELTRLYGVSDKAVRNWIEKAKLGKLNLELTVLDGKTYIKDSFHNSAVLEQVVLRGKKYHNKRAVHLVTPSHAFYELYTLDQVVDIINSI
ncbi:MAG TPA: hypothetical protein VIR03_00330, partial [Candidatus Saccharimonadales bacterium]